MLEITKLLRGPPSAIRSLNALTPHHHIIVTTLPIIGRWLFRLDYKVTYVRKSMSNSYDTRDIVDYPFNRENWRATSGSDWGKRFSVEHDREKFLMACCAWASCNLFRQCNDFPAEIYLPAQHGVFSYIFLSIISHPLRFMYML